MNKILWPVASVFVAAGIFFSSAQTGEASGNASMSIVEWLREVLPVYVPVDMLGTLHFLVRKGAHVVVYFVLAFCVANSLKFYMRKNYLLLSSWGISAAYGVIDEIHQYFVPGRAMLFTDMLINAAGAFVGAGLVVVLVAASERENKFGLAKYLRPFRRGLVLVIGLLFVQSLSELYLPTLMSSIVDDGIVYAYRTGVARTDFIWRTGIEMLFFALLAGTFSIVVAYISPKIAAGAARDLRRDLFIKVEEFSQAEFDKFSSASLITRCTNDVTQVQNVANISARMLLYAPVLAVGGIFLALTRAPSLSWILGLAVVVLFGIVILIVSIVMPKFSLVQEKTDGLNRVAREILHGLPVIRAFAAQAHEMERFDKSNTDLRDLGLFIAKTMAFIGPAITFIMGFTQVAIIFFGAQNVGILPNELQIGDMMAFFQYSMQVLFAFMMFSMVLVMVPRAQVSARRISEVLNTELTILDSDDPEVLGDAGPAVVFENVSFSYPNAEVFALEGVSFAAKAGETTAIIGATGAGKSTIAQLLLRFYDVSDGRILVGGCDIRLVQQSLLREKIGYVPQKGQLLSGTIESNIRYGNENAELEKIAAIAQASDFIAEKEGGFAAEISQGGSNVSGGQRQRIAIARAIAKKSEILIFDDAFSALDFETDARLRKSLRENVANAALIIIAQRVGTIINADQILVLDEGKIVGRGTHAELLQNCPEYLEIATSQGICA